MGADLGPAAESLPQCLGGLRARGAGGEAQVEPGGADAGRVLRHGVVRHRDDRAPGEAGRAAAVQGAGQADGTGGAVGTGQPDVGAGPGVDPPGGVGVEQDLAGAGRPPAVLEQLPAQRRVGRDRADRGRLVQRPPGGGQHPATADQPRRHRGHAGHLPRPVGRPGLQRALCLRPGHLDVGRPDLGGGGLAERVDQRPAAADRGDQEGHPQCDRRPGEDQLPELPSQLGQGVSVRRHRPSARPPDQP